MKGKWLTAGDVLKNVLVKRGLDEAVRRHSALLEWEEIVGSRIAEKACLKELKGKTLFVEVDGSAWIHELSFLRKDIVRKLNERAAGEEVVERIIFTPKGEAVDETGSGRRGRYGKRA